MQNPDSRPAQGLPSPAERPDLYDGFDGAERPAGWKNPVGTPERIEHLLARRSAAPAREPRVGTIPHRLLDGYDGDGQPPSPEEMTALIASAPDYVQERLAQPATERARLDFGALPPEEALRFRATDGLPSGWVLIENEGALFRGPAHDRPREVWSPRAQAFVPYAGSREKPVDWGDIIGVDEALALMSA